MGVCDEVRVRFWMFMVRQRQYKGGNVVGRAKLLILQKYEFVSERLAKRASDLRSRQTKKIEIEPSNALT